MTGKVTTYRYKRACMSCGIVYTFKSLTIPKMLDKERSTNYVCDNCQVVKNVSSGKTCESCKHFNTNYRTSGQNVFFRKCALGRVSDQEDRAEGDDTEYNLVYYKDYCQMHEEK